MAEPKKGSIKKEKSPIHEFEGQVKDIRQQFAEQLRCLETRTDVEVAVLSEIQDYFKKRADVELEYSRSLEKLAKQISTKHKAEKQKRESWQLFSLSSWWQQLINEAKTEARQRSVLADVYSNYAATKMSNQADELLRISKRCREIGAAAHQEILRVLGELHTAMKTYELCYAASRTAETKFRAVESQKTRFEETCPKKIGNRKHRLLEREYEKKQAKYLEFKLKALKARNEYLLCIDAANAALHKYFADDLSDLIDCMDVGIEQWIRAMVSTVLDARRRIIDAETKHSDGNKAWLRDLDARSDKRRFLEANHSTFMLPRKFEFRPQQGDDVSGLTCQKGVQEELLQRYGQLQRRLRELKTENEEIWKTYSMAERKLMEIQRQPELKIQQLFESPPSPPPHSTASASSVLNNHSAVTSCASSTTEPVTPRRSSCREPEAAQQKRKMDLCEMEEYLLQKFHQYLLTCNLINRLEARYDAIQNSLGIPGSPGADCVSLVSNGHDCASRYAVVREDSSHSLASSIVTDHTALVASTAALLCTSTTSHCQPSRPPSVTAKPRKKRVGHTAPIFNQRPRLFGGSLEEYVETTGEEIPLIIRSCVRMLSLYGLHHQGVFRVSGSQIEINNFKDSFERGEDPLADVTDASDVNSVAGVLKLYFRELREPLFPIFMFDQFVECTRCETKQEVIQKIKDLLKTLPRPVYVVMRYLFAFLSHLSEFSDENMMDPYNLAICFGPTLLPIPESRDQVFFHNHVNELVKNMIVYHEDIFSRNDPLGGIFYEKYLLTDSATGDVTNDEDDGVEDDVGGENGGRFGLSRSQEELTSKHSAAPSAAEADQKDTVERAVMVRTHSDLNLSSHVSLKDADSPGQACSDASPTSSEEPSHQAVWLRRACSGLLKDKATEQTDVPTSTVAPGEENQPIPTIMQCSVGSALKDDMRRSVNTALASRWPPKRYEELPFADGTPRGSVEQGISPNSARDAGTRSGAVFDMELALGTGRTVGCEYGYTGGPGAYGGMVDGSTCATALTKNASGTSIGYLRQHSNGSGSYSPKSARRDYVAVPLKRLSLSSYAYGTDPAPVTGDTAHFDGNQASAAVIPSEDHYAYQYSDTEVIRPSSMHHHQMPKGLSPTSLKEIQVELKAVLNSLESFTVQHQNRVNTTGMKEASFTSILSAPKTLVSSPVSPPDLVQNLPSPGEDTTGASPPINPTFPNPNLSAIPENGSGNSSLVSTAERFAENKENTLKKGIPPAPAPAAALPQQQGHVLIRKQQSLDQTVPTFGATTNTGGRPKPPVPKKPMVSVVRPTLSPQLARQRRPRGDSGADEQDYVL